MSAYGIVIFIQYPMVPPAIGLRLKRKMNEIFFSVF
jgi:hypothetical protein